MYDVGSPQQLAEKLLAFFEEKGIKEGIFLEAGANNGVWQSNTYYLEKKLGWSGILVEPNPRLFANCKDNRKNPDNEFFHCALVAAEYDQSSIRGYFAENDYENLLMAQIEGTYSQKKDRWWGKELVEVPAKTLDEILDSSSPEKIDLLVLDVEGYEAEALRGMDFQKHRPSRICVEVWEHLPSKEEVFQILQDNGYELEKKLTSQDYLYEDKKGKK
tara:strand:- start:659 stop:1309 length:651 start_codon:yes stop_codon:yes gene_type:complete